MDQETANVLFDKGAILLFLDAPENLEFGIDYNAWSTGPLFKGVKLIPPGLHFVFYSSTSKEGIPGMRTGFFKFFEAGEIVVRKWSNHTEDLLDESEMDTEQVERYKQDIKSFDRNLGPYPLAPPTNWQRWLNLTNHITKSLLHRIFPNNGIISHLPSKSNNSLPNLLEEMDRRMGRQVVEKEEGVEFTTFDPRQSFPPGASGSEITKWSLDKTWLTKELLKEVFNSDYHYMLGELQLAFVATLLGQNFTSFNQWKKLIQLLCSCQELVKESPQLFRDFLDVLKKQMNECPQDFFYDILSENDFLSKQFKTFSRNIPSSNKELQQQLMALNQTLKEKFNWEIPGLSVELKGYSHQDSDSEANDSEEEEGEYAPAIVEF
ncbi:A1 cistron-splicing factor [Umbelopsis sp. PMI_123]|nr:A1 cistron-splicing factor [Umbelopsis sp. PMI_123]